MERTRGLVARFIRNPDTGRVTLVQPPNTAILTWTLAHAVALGWHEHEAELRWLGDGALVVWATDELLRGKSPFRRTLGGSVLAYRVWQLSS